MAFLIEKKTECTASADESGRICMLPSVFLIEERRTVLFILMACDDAAGKHRRYEEDRTESSVGHDALGTPRSYLFCCIVRGIDRFVSFFVRCRAL